jgi:hypothetical protein
LLSHCSQIKQTKAAAATERGSAALTPAVILYIIVHMLAVLSFSVAVANFEGIVNEVNNGNATWVAGVPDRRYLL